MTDMRQLRVRIPDSLIQQAKIRAGDPSMSDTIATRQALALMAGIDPADWASHRNPGPAPGWKVTSRNVEPAA